jgi:hypothetical protein
MADPARPMTTAAHKPPAVQPVWMAALVALWRGFSEPSSLAFRSFCLSLAMTLGLCVWFFSPATLVGPMGVYLPRSALDSEGFATRAALRAGHVAPDRPRLILLGTSTVAQAIGAGTLLRDRIEAGTGREWEVVNLATPLQSPTDQFALLETALASQTADSPPALVAVGFGVQRLRLTPEQTLEYFEKARLGVASGWADEEARLLGGSVPERTGFYILDNWPFVLVNGSESLIRLALRRSARLDTEQFVRGVSRETPQRHAVIGQEIRDGVVRQASYLDQIARLAARVATIPNTRLVLIEEALSPALVAEQGLAGPRAALEEALRQRSAEGLPEFWPIMTEAGLSADEYFDELHILTGAPQERVQTALANHVTAAWPGLDGGTNGN